VISNELSTVGGWINPSNWSITGSFETIIRTSLLIRRVQYDSTQASNAIRSIVPQQMEDGSFMLSIHLIDQPSYQLFLTLIENAGFPSEPILDFSPNPIYDIRGNASTLINFLSTIANHYHSAHELLRVIQYNFNNALRSQYIVDYVFNVIPPTTQFHFINTAPIAPLPVPKPFPINEYQKRLDAINFTGYLPEGSTT
jgi:hypothetical protein